MQVPEKGGLRRVPSGQTSVATVKVVQSTLVCVDLTGKSRELWLAWLRTRLVEEVPHHGMLQCVPSRKDRSVSENALSVVASPSDSGTQKPPAESTNPIQPSADCGMEVEPDARDGNSLV